MSSFHNNLIAFAVVLVGLLFGFNTGHSQQVDSAESRPATKRQSSEQIDVEFIQSLCIDCHAVDVPAGDLNLEVVTAENWEHYRIDLERVLRQLRARRMPPIDAYRPTESEYQAIVDQLGQSLDRMAIENPTPGRTDTFRRLNRSEYRNAIRDLLGLDIDTDAMLPKDEESHGFDNVTVGNLSPTLLDRYISAAQKISRLAMGHADGEVEGTTIRVAPDVTQESHVEGLPLGTRGGTVFKHTFPRAGEYEFVIRLARDRNEEVEGLRGRHKLELLVDRLCESKFDVSRPSDGVSFAEVDAHLRARIKVTAGQHEIGVTFRNQSSSLLETERQPYESHFNFHRHPRLSPAIFQVSIIGPYETADADNQLPSYRQIMIADSSTHPDEASRATEILSRLMRLAYRRPVTPADLRVPLKLFHAVGKDDGFDAGIEMALSSILVNPNFLFRIEKDPPHQKPKTVYSITDLELASRLSFFLWSSIPDDELLTLAETEKLTKPDVLEQQVRRLLADPRSSSLVNNFAAQWLYLRNLDSFTPDARAFPDFDDNLRQALRTETELLFANIVEGDRSVLGLLNSNYTFLNERLAKHYGMPHVYGSHFRKVELPDDSVRGGLLRQASILTVTSYATRTSPVIRGNWVLENLMGIPTPPPPANVPSLDDNSVDASLPIRERLAQHRADPACAGCHKLMDPVGFALENFDAIGRWREMEAGTPIDNLGNLPDGSEFSGVEGLESGLLARPELFVGTLTEKLLTFALGRGVGVQDAAAVRKILASAQQADYKFSSLIIGIVNSPPFLMRTTE